MKSASDQFSTNANLALDNPILQHALLNVKQGLVNRRLQAIQRIPQFEEWRTYASQIKTHTLANMDFYLQQYEKKVIESGGQVHWASDAAEAQQIVLSICQQVGAKTVVKGKSMAGEEIGVNDILEENDMEVVETDLGEYIIQLAKEPPSHIIVPAVHKTKEQISDLFFENHQVYGCHERLTEVPDLVNEARKIMREKFHAADVGITGANFLIAETGTSVIVTNEGNGDLSSCLPRVHIVTAGIEKIVPKLADASLLLRLLARSATGQDSETYSTFFTGPKREQDQTGPDQYHVVLIDNHRTEMLSSELRPMLRCIRCGACMNHCPVYTSIGGHAYGWVYPGPMGSILTPSTIGLENAKELPNACTLNGRCASVCPVKIPLPSLLRSLRIRQFDRGMMSWQARTGLKFWGLLNRYPSLYGLATRIAVKGLGLLGKNGVIKSIPMDAGWTPHRDMTAPGKDTFMHLYAKQQKSGERS
jgi:L-lactate dehydrogenase complex protein LldF